MLSRSLPAVAALTLATSLSAAPVDYVREGLRILHESGQSDV